MCYTGKFFTILDDENRVTMEGLRVFVYRNLRKNLYSVRGPNGRVLNHVDNLLLKDVKYCVGKKGRERVLKEGQKNVHAGLRGTIVSHVPGCFNLDRDLPRITYDPWKFDSFVRVEDKSPIFKSKYAILSYIDNKPLIYAIEEDNIK